MFCTETLDKFLKKKVQSYITEVVQQVIEDVKFEKFLTNLTDEKRQLLEIDLSKINHTYTYANPISLLNEGLIISYPADKLIVYLKDYFGLDDGQIYKTTNDGIDKINIYVNNIEQNVYILKNALDRCGYFLAFPKERNIPKNQWARLQFEPKFQENILEKLKQTEKYLYHLSPIKYNNKIKSIGFCPKTKNNLFDYPDRIYFIKGSVDRNSVLNFGKQLCGWRIKDHNISSEKYVLYTISLSKIPDKVNFYIDTNFPDGVYTSDNLSPEVIINQEIIEF